MDIASLSMDLAQGRLLDQVGVSLLSKSLKGLDAEGASLIKLIEGAAPLSEGLGMKLDLLA